MNILNLIYRLKKQAYRFFTHFLLGVLGPIHTYVGIVLRRWFYRLVLSEVGMWVRIKPSVELMQPAGIILKSQVTIDPGVSIRCFGDDSQIVLNPNVHLDSGVNIRTHKSGQIKIGPNSYIGPYTCLSGDFISLGKDCMVASHCGIYANNHNFANTRMPMRVQGNSYQGIVIEDDCWLGTGTRVLDGVTIGKGSVVGAGSVVTKDIPPFSIAVGSPAKVIKQRKHSRDYASLDSLSSVAGM